MALAGVLILACSEQPAAAPGSQRSSAPQSTAIQCDSPPVVKLFGPAASADVGPLHLVGIYKGHGGQVEAYYSDGWPTYMPIVVDKPLESPVTIQGQRCAEGRQLRLWYRDGPMWQRGGLPFQARDVLDAKRERARDLTARLGPGQGSDTIRLPSSSSMPSTTMPGFEGYMLFDKPGNWKIRVEQEGKLVGTVVVAVATEF
jgi:hypothetical protein